MARQAVHAEGIVTAAIVSSELLTMLEPDASERWCRLLDCLLGKGVLVPWLKRSAIDADAVRKCVRLLCPERRARRPE